MLKSTKINPEIASEPEAKIELLSRPINLDENILTDEHNANDFVIPNDVKEYHDDYAVPEISGMKTEVLRTFNKKNKYDLDVDKFRNTCLENLNVSEAELGMLMYQKNSVSNNYFNKTVIPVYCSVRKIMNSYPKFEENFPYIFVKALSCTFDMKNKENFNFVNNIIQLVNENNYNELTIIEVNLNAHPGSFSLNKMNTDKIKKNLKPVFITNKIGGYIKRKKSNRIRKHICKTTKKKRAKRKTKKLTNY